MRFELRDCDAAAAESAIEWEETGCPLCGSAGWKLLLEAPDRTIGAAGLWFAVVQCRECGLCFTNPRPASHCVGQFYPDNYRPHQQKRERTRSWRPAWLARRDERHFLIPFGQRRLLDFGCGGGSFLERMRRQGWRVTGLDMSADAVARVHGLELDALVGGLPHPRLHPESFEAITMWQSLEHVHDPLTVLREARRLLVPGGKLVVAVPNIDSLPFRWFGPDWYGLDLPRHLTHFSPATLLAMLRRAEFRVEEIRPLAHVKWLQASARLACRSAHGTRRRGWAHWFKSRPLCRVVTWYNFLTRQCDAVQAIAVA